jgi:hypothetical protein
MSTPTSKRSDSRISLWQRLKNLVIEDVPEDLAICEFDCPKNQCTYGEWATCQRRIQLTALCHPELAESGQDATRDMASGSGSDLPQS